MTSVNDIMQAILKIDSADDMVKLNHFLVKRIKAKNAISNMQSAANFHIGQRVYFVSSKRGRGKVSGVVTDIMTKNVRMKADNGEIWRVAASMLVAE